jgi:hypothetical protein
MQTMQKTGAPKKKEKWLTEQNHGDGKKIMRFVKYTNAVVHGDWLRAPFLV